MVLDKNYDGLLHLESDVYEESTYEYSGDVISDEDMIRNDPMLFICYREDGEDVRIGPYYTIRPDGCSSLEWQTYKVQTEKLKFEKVTVPWYHVIMGMVEKEKLK